MFIRRLPKLSYHTPGSLSEALELLSAYGSDAKLLAGGTDLLLAMKKRATVPMHLINLKTVPGLSGITADAGGLTIGSLTTIAEIERSDLIRETYSPLWDAACVMASPQIRTLATVGGNLVSAVPSADMAPPLMVLSAQMHITGLSGERTCPVESFFAGPSACTLGPTEIVTRITIPAPKGKAVYLKLMRRGALDLGFPREPRQSLGNRRPGFQELLVSLGPIHCRVQQGHAALVQGVECHMVDYAVMILLNLNVCTERVLCGL